MYSLNRLVCVLKGFAPLELSVKQIEKGAYDNSGVIVKLHDEIKSVLFSLDLSEAAVEFAKKINADTVVTHHPAIYYPVKSLSVDDKATSPLIRAVENGVNVVSMHLNLDVANGGIDYELCRGFEGVNEKILFYVDDTCGYGREFCLPDGSDLKKLKEIIIKEFGTDKILVYGEKDGRIDKVASFCGGGASHALDAVKNKLTDAHTLITSDMPHHVIKELVEYGKTVILIPHYASENYGFKKFYENVKNKTDGELSTSYFDDKRFS